MTDLEAGRLVFTLVGMAIAAPLVGYTIDLVDWVVWKLRGRKGDA